jgi:hypothetical protein
MNDLATFARRMDRIAVQVEGNAEKAVRDCASAVARSVIEATPADTGKAMSNWIAQLDAPSAGQREAHVPGTAGSTADINGQAAINQAIDVIRRYRAGQNRSINITNNLPYIGALNDGHSKQAPSEFVRIATFDGIASIRGAKLLEK